MTTETITEGQCPAEIECPKCGTVFSPEVTDSETCPNCGHDCSE